MVAVKAENSTTVVDRQQAVVYAQDEHIVTSSSPMNQPNFKSKGAISQAINYKYLSKDNQEELN